MGSEDRIAALEAAVVALAEQVAETAAVTVAQGVIVRALTEGLARGTGTTVGDVHDFALAMAEHLPAEIGAAVGAMLAEAPARSGALH